MTTTLDHRLTAAMADVTRGDQDAFALVYDHTAARIFGVVLRVLRDHSQAEEVTQEVYLQVWRQAADYDPGHGRVTTWITSIAHRRAVDRVRQVERRKRREHLQAVRDLEPHEPDVSEQVLQGDESANVRAALSELSDVQREALEMTYVQGRTHTEAAEHLGVPLGTFKSRVRDGVRALRDRWKVS